jgi:hypothetical protein
MDKTKLQNLTLIQIIGPFWVVFSPHPNPKARAMKIMEARLGALHLQH